MKTFQIMLRSPGTTMHNLDSLPFCPAGTLISTLISLMCNYAVPLFILIYTHTYTNLPTYSDT